MSNYLLEPRSSDQLTKQRKSLYDNFKTHSNIRKSLADNKFDYVDQIFNDTLEHDNSVSGLDKSCIKLGNTILEIGKPASDIIAAEIKKGHINPLDNNEEAVTVMYGVVSNPQINARRLAVRSVLEIQADQPAHTFSSSVSNQAALSPVSPRSPIEISPRNFKSAPVINAPKSSNPDAYGRSGSLTAARNGSLVGARNGSITENPDGTRSGRRPSKVAFVPSTSSLIPTGVFYFNIFKLNIFSFQVVLRVLM